MPLPDHEDINPCLLRWLPPDAGTIVAGWCGAGLWYRSLCDRLPELNAELRDRAPELFEPARTAIMQEVA